MSSEKEFYSLEEVGERLGVTYQLIYRLVRAGELPAMRIGKLYRVSGKDLDHYLEQSKQASVSGGVCSNCGKTYQSRLSLSQVCSEDGCEAPVCVDCWERKKQRYCKQHRPTPAAGLELSGEKNAKH